MAGERWELMSPGDVPKDVWDWFGGAGEGTLAAVEPLIYVRLTTNPDRFANVPLRFLDEKVTWSVPGDKCPAVIIKHVWKGTDTVVKQAVHVCAAVLAEVKMEQGVMNQPAAPAVLAVPATVVEDDPTKPFTLSTPL